jgi:hypothetical protein
LAELYNISDWIIHEWSKPTMGTRAKNYVEDPATGQIYFFKESAERFPEEFWSEIISSKFGQLIGLNVLNYDIAIYKTIPGCISEHMTIRGHRQLYHAVDLFKDFLPGFLVSDKPKFSIQDIISICDLIPFFKKFKSNIIEMIIFDALIGNGDRHLENWALVLDYDAPLRTYPKINLNSFKLLFLKAVRTFFKTQNEINEEEILFNSIDSMYSYAPIYDSGSCLGREIKETEIDAFLGNEQKFNKYLRKGVNEIRWKEDRINFFELVSNIQQLYPEEVSRIAKGIFKLAEEEKILTIVETIDEKLNVDFEHFKLSSRRKKLIAQLLLKRTSYLKESLNLD